MREIDSVPYWRGRDPDPLMGTLEQFVPCEYAVQPFKSLEAICPPGFLLPPLSSPLSSSPLLSPLVPSPPAALALRPERENSVWAATVISDMFCFKPLVIRFLSPRNGASSPSIISNPRSSGRPEPPHRSRAVVSADEPLILFGRVL